MQNPKGSSQRSIYTTTEKSLLNVLISTLTSKSIISPPTNSSQIHLSNKHSDYCLFHVDCRSGTASWAALGHNYGHHSRLQRSQSQRYWWKFAHHWLLLFAHGANLVLGWHGFHPSQWTTEFDSHEYNISKQIEQTVNVEGITVRGREAGLGEFTTILIDHSIIILTLSH